MVGGGWWVVDLQETSYIINCLPVVNSRSSRELIVHALTSPLIPVASLFPSNTMAAAFWNLDKLLQDSSGPRIIALTRVMKEFLDNTVLTEVLQSLLDNEIDMKEFSRGGAVHIRRRHVDIGNFKYAFLFCSLARLSRTCHTHLAGLFIQLGERYETLVINAPFTETMLFMKGDVMECVLAKSLLTGALIEEDEKLPRHQMQSMFRRFDEAVDDVYRICFRDWTGPPRSNQMVNVADLSALVLIVHGMQSPGVSEAYRANYRLNFNLLSQKALKPLLPGRTCLQTNDILCPLSRGSYE